MMRIAILMDESRPASTPTAVILRPGDTLP